MMAVDPGRPRGVDVRRAKALLRDKLVKLQTRIDELNRRLREAEQASRGRERALMLELLSVIDVVDVLDENAGHEGSGSMPSDSAQAVRRKLARILEARRVVPIEFPDNKARMESCKVVDAKPAAGMEDETILSVVRRGYMDEERGEVLRKAEVITVRNG